MTQRDDSRRAADFPATDWSTATHGGEASGRRRKLERLLRRYWQPVYWFIRCHGRPHEDAKDLTQGFFLHVMESDTLDRYRGQSRFRSFLKGAARHFLQHDAQERQALKRGDPVPLDGELVEPQDESDPNRAFDAAWVRLILERATRDLLPTLRPRVRRVIEMYDLPVLRGEAGPSRPEVAERLGIKLADFDNDLRSARAKLRELIRDIVRETVGTYDDLDDELKFILRSAP